MPMISIGMFDGHIHYSGKKNYYIHVYIHFWKVGGGVRWEATIIHTAPGSSVHLFQQLQNCVCGPDAGDFLGSVADCFDAPSYIPEFWFFLKIAINIKLLHFVVQNPYWIIHNGIECRFSGFEFIQSLFHKHLCVNKLTRNM